MCVQRSWGTGVERTDSSWTCSSSLQWNRLENYKQRNDRTSPKGTTLAAETRSGETVELMELAASWTNDSESKFQEGTWAG